MVFVERELGIKQVYILENVVQNLPKITETCPHSESENPQSLSIVLRENDKHLTLQVFSDCQRDDRLVHRLALFFVLLVLAVVVAYLVVRLKVEERM